VTIRPCRNRALWSEPHSDLGERPLLDRQPYAANQFCGELPTARTLWPAPAVSETAAWQAAAVVRCGDARGKLRLPRAARMAAEASGVFAVLDQRNRAWSRTSPAGVTTTRSTTSSRPGPALGHSPTTASPPPRGRQRVDPLLRGCPPPASKSSSWTCLASRRWPGPR